MDKERAEGNVSTIYGMERVPCDTPMRAILDPVSPKGLRPVFQSVLRPRQGGTALEARTFLAGHSLLALDGTASFSSRALHGASWLPKGHRTGTLPSSHQLLGAALVHPDQRAVLPRMPEPMVRPAGTAPHACERHAAKRFVAKLRQEPPQLTCMSTADSLSAHAPHSEPLHAYGLHDILGVTAGAHASWCREVEAAEPAGRVTS